MIRLTTVLLTLGVGMVIATTANAVEPEGSCNCNPEAPGCRIICGSVPSDPPQQWAPRYVAPAHPRSMYMYVPRHSPRAHRTGTNGRY
jgi:hypothetical protein